MKINVKSPGKIALSVIVCGFFITSCSNRGAADDTNPATIVGGTDTTMTVSHDSIAADQTHVALPVDTTSMARPDSAAVKSSSLDSASKSKTGKSKKGKVTILPTDTKSNTAAMEVDKEGYYKNTEVLPAFPGGQKALERFFESNLQYPEAATDNQAEGTVKLTFNVDENGKIYQPLTVGDKIGYGIEEEAIRVFNKMPKWTPGKIKGKNVKTRFTLPIRFQLN